MEHRRGPDDKLGQVWDMIAFILTLALIIYVHLN